jgi:hypothetical protein
MEAVRAYASVSVRWTSPASKVSLAACFSSILPRHFVASLPIAMQRRASSEASQFRERRHCNGHNTGQRGGSLAPRSLRWWLRTMLGHEMIQPQLPPTRSNAASDNRNTDR